MSKQQITTERELIEELPPQRQQQPQKSDELERQILEVLRARLFPRAI